MSGEREIRSPLEHAATSPNGARDVFLAAAARGYVGMLVAAGLVEEGDIVLARNAFDLAVETEASIREWIDDPDVLEALDESPPPGTVWIVLRFAGGVLGVVASRPFVAP